MHIQTHVMSSWCIANALPISPRQRLLCMLAGSLADLDGLGIVAGMEAYWRYHHVLGHNVFLAAALSAVLAFISQQRLRSLLIYFAIFHLHLVLDYFGSGPLWKMYYLYPLSDWPLEFTGAWEFFSWQNLSVGAAALAGTVVIAVRLRRTPLESLMPSLDRKIVSWLRRMMRLPADAAAPPMLVSTVPDNPGKP